MPVLNMVIIYIPYGALYVVDKLILLIRVILLLVPLNFLISLNLSLNLEKTPTRPGDKLFLSQIMSNLHQTFRISS